MGKLKQLLVTIYHKAYNKIVGEVIMLHRIGPWDSDRLITLEELKVTEERLQEYIDKMRVTHDFISIEELENRIRHPKKRPFICVTIDDGYKDNLIYGLPVFERNNVPFALFITTEFIDNPHAFNWPFIVERIIKNNDSLIVNGVIYDCSTIDAKNKTFLSFRKMILDWGYKGLETIFNEAFEEYLKEEYYENLTMSWQEVRSIAASPLCTIGSHCASHCRVVNMTYAEIAKEFSTSKHILEEHIGKNVNCISYPFGCKEDVKDEAANVAKKVGYRLGFIVGGNCRRATNLLKIPRTMMYDFK